MSAEHITGVEEWRPVREFESFYAVSSLGRVRSLPRVTMRKDGKPLTVPGRLLYARANSRGYPRLSLCRGGDARCVTVHSLVAAAFLPPPPAPIGSHAGEYTVNHIDGDKTNNTIENLEYITCTENVYHALRTGLLRQRGVDNARAKIGVDDVLRIRRLYAKGARQVDLASEFRIDQTQVSRIVRGESWRHVA